MDQRDTREWYKDLQSRSAPRILKEGRLSVPQTDDYALRLPKV